MRLTVLNPKNPAQDFPPITKALTEPDGLLAIGGCLSTERLLKAYRLGIFPWFNPDEPILWWSPNPRLVLFPDKLSISRSLARTLRRNSFTITCDKAFDQVVNACAAPRKQSDGTWIGRDIHQAYRELHHKGYAHSVEAWMDNELVGGFYGVALGQVFFGESMFHKKTDASKVAFVTLVKHMQHWGYQLIDCQVHTSHLSSFGAIEIEREQFSDILNICCERPVDPGAWTLP
jgi:leucyl/phenylalanyl-tRNA--protein transferase